VAYYTVPFDTSFRATSLPLTAVNALIPALAEARNRPQDSARMVALAVRALILLVLPPVLVAAVFAHPLLAWWLNPAFAGPATPVLQLLLVGIFINSLAHVPYALLQAHGRSDLTAKLHVFELPVFAVVLVLSVNAFGITGAALAWMLRVALDTALLYGSAWWLNPVHRNVLLKAAAWTALTAVLLALAIFSLPQNLKMPLAAIVAMLGAAMALHMLHLLRAEPQQETLP
jgi:O-antigen/teichoic acid export membrane protein